MPKRVSVYERADVLYVVTSHQTQAGFWADDEHVAVIAAQQITDIGSVVEAALSRSREGVPNPTPLIDLSAPLLAAAGLASWNVFTRGAKYVGIRQNGEAIKVTPYKNLGGKDGFDPMQGKAILLQSGDSGLAAAIVSALETAE